MNDKQRGLEFGESFLDGVALSLDQKTVQDVLSTLDTDKEPIDFKRGPGLEFKAEDVNSPGSIMKLSGYASTKEIDSYNEIVEPNAFKDTMAEFMEFPIILFGHAWFDKPIGKVVEHKIDDVGLWVEIELSDTAEARDVKGLVDHGILKAFSIGFRPLSVEQPDDEDSGDPVIIKKLRLYEISIVSVPANRAAVFDQAKQLGLSIKSLNIKETEIEKEALDGEAVKRKGFKMSHDSETLKKCDDLIVRCGGFDDGIADLASDYASHQTMLDDHGKLVKQLGDKATELENGKISKGEHQTFVEKIGADFLELKTQFEKFDRAKGVVAARQPYSDWRMMPGAEGLLDYRNDDGIPLTAIERKSYQLLGTPMKYDGPEANAIRTFRELNDIVYTASVAMNRGRGINVETLKSFQLMRELAEHIDPEFAKAMSSTGTGTGLEWIPTGYSVEYWDLYRLETVLMGHMETFDMPTNPYIWKILSAGAKAYRMAEAVTNNPDNAKPSNITTGKVTFTAEKYGVAIPASDEFLEDAITLVAPALRKEMAIAHAISDESVVINGDASATHIDNATVTWYQSYDPETYGTGFRETAVNDSKTFDASTFVAADWRNLRKLMGPLGKRPQDVVFYTGIAGYFKTLAMAEFSQPGTYNAGNTWSLGALDAIDGSPLVVSSAVREDLNATGIYDGTTKTKTIAGAFNRRSFKIGRRKDVTLETDKNIMTGQWSFVSSARWDMQDMTPSTQYPSAIAYNIAN